MPMALEKSTMILAIVVISMAAMIAGQGHGIHVGFYDTPETCKGHDVERIIYKVVEEHVRNDETVVAALLRMQFHDCFVRGCDASILLNGTTTEKTANPNLSVRGYGLIDAAKEAVEEACPGVVSCADVIVIATRAAVYLQSGHWYDVETGRLDGRVSLAIDALLNLPSPSISVSSALNVFQARNLNAQDFVLLLAGHTVGVTHCSQIKNRLYNYRFTRKPDPSMNPILLSSLQKICLNHDERPILLDHTLNSGFLVDDGFLRAIKDNYGVLEIDQRIANDPLTSDIVTRLVESADFWPKFGDAMVKLGRVPMPLGSLGEIRTTCGAVNHLSIH